jgi:hypothetical protein
MQFEQCKIPQGVGIGKKFEDAYPHRYQVHPSPAVQSLSEIHAVPFLQGIFSIFPQFFC